MTHFYATPMSQLLEKALVSVDLFGLRQSLPEVGDWVQSVC